jgi:hypothetical protein
MGWKGNYPQDPGAVIHVSAAAFHGRPVYFQVIAPWNRPERDQPPRDSGRDTMSRIASLTMLLGLLGVGVYLVWNNVVQDRSDLKGAVRIAIFTFSAEGIAWLFVSHHQSTAGGEATLFYSGFQATLWYVFLTVGAYLAFEPYVRRRFPEMITSWTRLIAGQWRDALVARHALTGVLSGAVFSVARSIGDAWPVWFNLRGQAPRQYFTAALASLPGAFGIVSGYAAARLLQGLSLIFLLFLFRALTKRRWAAEMGASLIFAANVHRPGTLSEQAPFALFWAATMTLIGSRVGLVAFFAFDLTQAILQGFPLTLHPSDWYFSRTVMALAICLSLAAYSFYNSLEKRLP